jgi:hypothetical protein
MNVRQHLPSAVKIFEPENANITTLEELLDLPWLQFNRLSHHCMRKGHWVLMAELKGVWRAVAFVSGDDAEYIMNMLPRWTYAMA